MGGPYSPGIRNPLREGFTMAIDPTKFTSTLPYSAELLGVHQPLPG